MQASYDSKGKNWLGEVQGIREVAEAERNGLSELCKIYPIYASIS